MSNNSLVLPNVSFNDLYNIKKVSKLTRNRLLQPSITSNSMGNSLLGTCAVLRLLLGFLFWLFTESAALHVLLKATITFQQAVVHELCRGCILCKELVLEHKTYPVHYSVVCTHQKKNSSGSWNRTNTSIFCLKVMSLACYHYTIPQYKTYKLSRNFESNKFL